MGAAFASTPVSLPPLPPLGPLAFLGRTVVDTPKFGVLRGLEGTLTFVAVSGNGTIVEVVRGDDAEAERRANAHGSTRRLGPREYLSPGFVDAHIHCSQLPFTGTGIDRPLMADDGFLMKYAFPTEASMSDGVKADSLATAAIDEMLKHGTTTAMIYGPASASACDCLVDAAIQRGGPRAFVGKVCMDRHTPEYYVEDTAASLAETEAFIVRTRAKAKALSGSSPVSDAALPPPLVEAVVTPRFLPTCTPELLGGLGALAVKYDAPIQSHLSESLDEMHFSKAMYPQFATDAAAYDAFGLLRAPCVQGHCVHLQAGEEELMRTRGAAIAHCPLSNFFFAKEALPVRRLVQRGVRVGLGTDVAGGYSPSMLNAMRTAVLASKTLQFRRDEGSATALELPRAARADAAADATIEEDSLRRAHDLSHFDALWLATLGGAAALALSDKLGTFDVGKTFDALVLRAPPNVLAFEGGTAEAPDDVLQKIITLGDDRNVAEVYVGGRRVK